MDKQTEEFRGCGFVEFEDDSYIDKVSCGFVDPPSIARVTLIQAAAKNGAKLNGRTIRVDYAASNK